jgi:hypothetical protein
MSSGEATADGDIFIGRFPTVEGLELTMTAGWLERNKEVRETNVVHS